MVHKNKNLAKGILLALLLFASGAIVASKNKTQPMNESSSFNYKENNTTPLSSIVNQNSSNVPTLKPASPEPSAAKRIARITLNYDRTVVLIGQIDDNALVAASKITELSKISAEPITLILSGPGGSVVTGSILISAIEASRAPVITICDVLCASMDSMIHQFGAKRLMTDRTIIMFHPASASSQGDVDRMYSMTSFLKRYTNKLEVYVAQRQSRTFEQYKLHTGVELWLDAEDALTEKVSDGIVNYSLDKKILPINDLQQKQTNKQESTAPLDFQWMCITTFCKGFKWTTLR